MKHASTPTENNATRHASPACNGKASHETSTGCRNPLSGLDVTLRLSLTHCARRPYTHEHVGVHGRPRAS